MEDPRESFGELKRRIYLATMIVALIASVLGLVLSELTGISTLFIRGLLSATSLFLVAAVLLLYTGRLIRAAEEALYIFPGAILLLVLLYALYAPVTQEQSLSALRGSYLWFPAVYILIFLIHGGRAALPRAAAFYLLVVAVSLPEALSTLGSEQPYSGLNDLSLDQLYLSSFVVITLLVFVNRLKDRLRESEVTAERMKRLAHTDPLTGLYNRRHIEELLEGEMERCRRYGLPLSVIIFDVDDFKRINDDHGHDAGDAALIEISRLVTPRLRESDRFGRWGGEEFLIVAPETPPEAAQRLAGRLRLAIEEHDFGAAGRVSASFGITMLHPDDSKTRLVKRADVAVYRSKTGGKNRTEVETVSA